MANIKIDNLNPVGSAFFNDSESYLTDLTESELTNTNGGIIITFLAITLYAGYRYGYGQGC